MIYVSTSPESKRDPFRGTSTRACETKLADSRRYFSALGAARSVAYLDGLDETLSETRQTAYVVRDDGDANSEFSRAGGGLSAGNSDIRRACHARWIELWGRCCSGEEIRAEQRAGVMR